MQQMKTTQQQVKVVVRYRDGKMVKGSTLDFNANTPRFHVRPASDPAAAVSEVNLSDLKAIFFVRDFHGDPTREDKNAFPPEARPNGRKMEITFFDGEKLVGSTMGYDGKRAGFFLFPPEGDTNNVKIFAVQAAVKSVRYL
jgi:hypothetical protein